VPNWAFNADANTGHGFAIFMASVGALRLRLRRRLTLALGNTKFQVQFQRVFLLFRLSLREQISIRKAQSKLIVGLASAQAQR